MYFAVDPIRPGLPERILSTLAQLREQNAAAPIYCYLLIDASFDQALPGAYPWRGSVECSLYDGMRLEGLKEVSPHLLRLRDGPEMQLAWLQQLVEVCTGKPMLSVIFSAIPADQLRAHFQPYLRSLTEDSLEWPVRWADTRVLPGLIAALTQDERRHLLSPLYAWMAVDRRGEPIAWQGEGNPQPEAAGFDCWPLDEARFGRLVGDAEADAVLSQIDDRRPDLLANGQPADLHFKVSGQLALATHYKIEEAQNRLHFSMLGLMLAPGFTDDPMLRPILGKISQGASYQEQLAQLPESFWAQYLQGKAE